MLTDREPLDPVHRAGFFKSDQHRTLELPRDDCLHSAAKFVESSLKEGAKKTREACEEFLTAAADFYQVQTPGIRILAARPLRTREGGWASELFGDYDPASGLIRIWMRTAIRKQVTSFGTFFSTLCHEFCHHLDYQKFGFLDSWHTRGFYERSAALYHYARGTPAKRLFWIKIAGGRYRIDWPRTNRGS